MRTAINKNALYLGDGAYVCVCHSGEFRVFTHDGVDITNEIWMSAPMVKALYEYMQKVEELQCQMNPEL
jgi:hypothetical protein